MKLVTRKLKSLRPAPWNPRENLQPGEHEYEAIKASLGEFGLVQPLVLNKRSGFLVGGHQRRSVMLAEGLTEAQVVEVDLDEAAEKRLGLQLNGTGRWDNEKLATMLAEMKAQDIDLTTLGFNQEKIDDLLGIGGPAGQSGAGTLAQRFMVPPFTVLNAREGWWQERKAAWIALGIKSELGRGAGAEPGGSKQPTINPATGKICRADSKGAMIPGTDAKHRSTPPPRPVRDPQL